MPTKTFSPDLTQLLRNLVKYTGRDPAGFEATVLDDGSISIRGPGAAAFYPAEAWTSKFVRHLHRGFFEQARSVASAE